MPNFRSEAQTEGPQTTADDLGLSKQAQSALGTDSTDPFDRYLKRMQDSTRVERKKAQEAETDISTKKIEMEKNRLKQEYDLATKQSGETRGIISDYSKQLMAPSPKREIEAQTKEGMMGLAALLPVAGAFFGGKGLTSATGAMQAMTGLVKGYQEGNKERIAFEQKKYDDAIKEFDRHQQQIKTAFDMALKNAQINQNAAQAKLKMDLYTLNAPMLAELVEKQGIVKTSETNIQMIENVAKQRLQHEAQLQTATEVAKIRASAASARGPSAILQGRAENVREAFVQAAQDVENITYLPPDTVLGTFAGMTGKSGEGLIDALRNTFTRSVTPAEQRALQQLTAGIESHLAFALGGGYASSQAKGNMDRYKAQLAQEGDEPAANALFMARVRQELNLLAQNFPSKPGATKEMNDAVQYFNNVVNESIPFTVKDVLKAINAGEQPPSASRAGSSSTSSSDGWTARKID
jgi:hypothetical protein